MSNNIREWVSQLLVCTTAGAAKPVVDNLVQELCAITGLELHPAVFLDEHATITAQGKAVSPTTAAQCAEDVQRTCIFMQGVYAAIQQKLLQKNPQSTSQPIHILYAGTGPFGLLLIPLLPLLDAAQVQVTLLDIHAESLDKLQRLIEALGVGHFIQQTELADASTWQTGQRFDLIISETMRQGLIQEPQVSIFSHLQQFLLPDGWLIPEAIRLDVWLSAGRTAISRAPERRDLLLGTVFQLDKTTAIRLGRGDDSCAQASLLVPDYPAALTDLKLTTFIRVFGAYQLHENQSQLTLPLYERNARVLPNSVLHCRYELGTYPRCVFTYGQLPELAEQPLPDSLQPGALGLYHLARLWHKIQLRKQEPGSAKTQQRLAEISADEWLLDRLLLEQLGVALAPAMQQLFTAASLAEIEAWLTGMDANGFSAERIQRINSAIVDFVEHHHCERDAALVL